MIRTIPSVVFSVLLTLAMCQTSLADERAQDLNQVYLEVSQYNYVEPDFMSKSSTFPGVGIYIEHADIDWSPQVSHQLAVKIGETAYLGTGVTSGDPFYALQYQVDYNKEMEQLGGHIGLGYHLQYDDWGGKRTSTGQYTYDRQSEYFFAALGLSFNFKTQWQGSVEVRRLIAGRQTVYFPSDLGGETYVMRQHNGVGLKVEIQMLDNLIFFNDLWIIERSDTASPTSPLYEPANTSFSFGVRYRVD